MHERTEIGTQRARDSRPPYLSRARDVSDEPPVLLPEHACAPPKCLDGKHVDAVDVNRADARVALADAESGVEVEIETGDSDIKHNIESDLKAGFTYVLSVPTNPRAERKTQELIGREGYSDKVRVVPARMFKIKARPA